MATITRHSSGLPADIDPLNTRPQLPTRWEELQALAADGRRSPEIEPASVAVQARLLIGAVLLLAAALMWLVSNG